MALFSFHAAAVGRAQKKSSAVQVAAYQARENLYDRVTQETYYFSNQNKYGGILAKGIITPEGCPSWAKDRKKLWTSAEEFDSRKNSQFAKSYILALQDELTLDENKKVLMQFIKNNFTSRGLVVDVAIHKPSKEGDKRNTHAHLLVSTRSLTTKMGWGGKDRETDGLKFLYALRQNWADEINNAFINKGIPARVSHETLEAQGTDRAPQQHQGAAATAMERAAKKNSGKEMPYRTRKKEKDIFDKNEVAELLIEIANGKKSKEPEPPKVTTPPPPKAEPPKVTTPEIEKAKIIIDYLPQIKYELESEAADMQKRRASGKFDEHFNKDRLICVETTKLYNQATEIQNVKKPEAQQTLNALCDSLYYDPTVKSKIKQPFFNFKYSNQRYKIWAPLTQKIKKTIDRLFPKNPRADELETGRKAGRH